MYYSYIGNLLHKHNHHSFSGVVLYTEFSKLEYELTRVRDKDCVKNRVKRAKIVRFTLC